MLIDSSKMIIKDNGTFKSYYFSEFGDVFTFDNEGVIALIPMYYFFLFIVMIFIFVFNFIGYFFSALVIAAIGAGILGCLHMKVPFGKVYKMSIYARTLPLLLGALFSIIGLKIPFFWWLGVILSSVYLLLAFNKMKKSMQPIMNMNQPYYSGQSYYSGQPYTMNSQNQDMINQANQGPGMDDQDQIR